MKAEYAEKEEQRAAEEGAGAPRTAPVPRHLAERRPSISSSSLSSSSTSLRPAANLMDDPVPANASAANANANASAENANASHAADAQSRRASTSGESGYADTEELLRVYFYLVFFWVFYLFISLIINFVEIGCCKHILVHEICCRRLEDITNTTIA